MQKRLQSPSSINTYIQCPRRYYYKYVLALPTKSTVQQVRGKIAHAVLEDFFDIDAVSITMGDFEAALKRKMQALLMEHWQQNRELLQGFELNADQQKFMFGETLLMLLNWLDQFIRKVRSFDNLSFAEIFVKLTPLREEEYISQDLFVRGYIDAIEFEGDQVSIMDYKTNANLDISEEQRLQLAIYSLLYKGKHGKPPNRAGIYFLRNKAKYLPVDGVLLQEAEDAIKLVHDKTQIDGMENYPQRTGPLCKWCDFYSLCFEQKKIEDYTAEVKENPLLVNRQVTIQVSGMPRPGTTS